MIALSYIMIHVGYEFIIDKANIHNYGKDYLIAASTAGLPWIFVTIYFVYFFSSDNGSTWNSWKESLLLARFAAPTSAGILFSMLAVAGLGSTWVFRKARLLAIFDDFDTVILMIPLKFLIFGFQWQSVIIVLILLGLLLYAWKNLHMFKLPITSRWVLIYAVLISGFSEFIYYISSLYSADSSIYIEVFLPAFFLGCVIKKQNIHTAVKVIDIVDTLKESRRSYFVSAIFMTLIGLSMPSIINIFSDIPDIVVHSMPWYMIIYHVIVVTLLSNLGKLFPVFCYRKDVNLKSRLALGLVMFPRGEVGAGVILMAIVYGMGGPIIIVSILSLALNLILTGLYIFFVKKLVKL